MPKPHWSAYMRGEPRKSGQMNKTEQRYADELALLLRHGDIVFWQFEAIKLRLADNTFYTPDFLVMYPNGLVELVEIKGFWTSSARVKTKVAAELFWMFRFIALQPRPKKDGGGWRRENFNQK